MIHPYDISNKRIGFSVLNWGLGHLTRSLPLISALQDQKNVLFIFCSEAQKKIFAQYLQDVVFVNHSDYPFKFRGKGNFKMDLFRTAPSLFRFLVKEKRLSEGFVKTYDLNLLISDQRYGFYSAFVPSIFITHQMRLPVSGLSRVFNFINRYCISKFNNVWIMDQKKNRLAGKLSENKDENHACYIGSYSRFTLKDKVEKSLNGLLVLNGPVAYNYFLLDHFSKELEAGEIDHIVGPESALKLLRTRNITTPFISNSDMLQIDTAFLSANKVFGFFGYSTLMDCLELKCNFDLVPTPGQAEQKYLAFRHKKSL